MDDDTSRVSVPDMTSYVVVVVGGSRGKLKGELPWKHPGECTR